MVSFVEIHITILENQKIGHAPFPDSCDSHHPCFQLKSFFQVLFHHTSLLFQLENNIEQKERSDSLESTLFLENLKENLLIIILRNFVKLAYL